MDRTSRVQLSNGLKGNIVEYQKHGIVVVKVDGVLPDRYTFRPVPLRDLKTIKE